MAEALLNDIALDRLLELELAALQRELLSTVFIFRRSHNDLFYGVLPSTILLALLNSQEAQQITF